MTNKYKIREICGGWALDIPRPDLTGVLIFKSRSNAELVKAILEWEDAHPNEAVPYYQRHSIEPLNLYRMLEILEADLGGRCVVLPRKPCNLFCSGSEIYMIDDGEVYEDHIREVTIGESEHERNTLSILYETGDGCMFYEREWGKTVFLTYEAAEAALKGENHG